jgi:putative flippase GtrA
LNAETAVDDTIRFGTSRPAAVITPRGAFTEGPQVCHTLDKVARSIVDGMKPVVDIVIPVYNEAADVERSVRRLRDYLLAVSPFPFRITIADNASTDDTLALAHDLARSLPAVTVVHLDQKGRGRALRHVWSASDAQVLAYMDIDLSTDLAALLPLVAPLLSGHSDVAIGSRLARGSRVTRGVKRELISRSYNRILHLALRAQFSDAQYGFKAVRGDVLPSLLGDVQDDAWFFDTELLVLAQRRGLRIHEVPVDWVDDPDSRVDIIATALADLRGVLRLQAGSTMLRFLGIGVACTLAYALLFVLLAGIVSAALASGLALGVTAVANTAANRRWSFRIRGREQRLRQYAAGAVVFALTLGLTDGALALLDAGDPRAGRALQLSVLVVASIAATVTRYVALRSWVFTPVGHGLDSPRRAAPSAAHH